MRTRYSRRHAADSSNWAILLAGGDGTRLGSLTIDALGRRRPKQFCSLRGGPTLFGMAATRARRLVPADRVTAVVAESHRALWQADAAGLPRDHFAVQPQNRGTAVGMALGLLTVLERDPAATVVALPADHFFAQERVFAAAARRALRAARNGGIVLLGMAPEFAATDYGWIVPGQGNGLRTVAAFEEKPERERAEALRALGGLWNSFIIAARAAELLDMIAARAPHAVADLRWAFAATGPSRQQRLAAIYDEIAPADLSRDVFQGAEDNLRVIEIPPCGWTDLGTPDRVASCLRQLPAPRRPRPHRDGIDLSGALLRVGLEAG